MELSKYRLEAFSDGVMAIIITIMVLGIPLTNNFNFEGIVSLLYSIFIFFVSFFIVGSFWNKHHQLIDSVTKITNKIVWKNMMFLFFLALLPIFTKWVLTNPDELIPVVAYDILFILVNLSYYLIVSEIYGKQEHTHEKMHRNNKRSPLHIIFTGIFVIIFVIVAILIPQITIVLFMGFPILFGLLNIFLDRQDPVETSISTEK